ncbi:hypothetical protein [Bradyrhizobium cenepequi]|uniref:hypothetical protein n=1 Tax=Bradyrhizobium cenepequi TaxID=2821403 RepID=UPI001CE3ACE3|nr:hypothetical protein [Bradyrhizobium cenepequi]MCA6108108.1 hypothetical protein [Bradyrhizobium cenepequi]
MARTAIRKPAKGVDAPAGDGVAKPHHGKTRLRKNQAQSSALDLPADLIARIRENYDADLQWVVDQVLNKDEPAMRQEYEINAWEPVTTDMFDGAFDGMYLRKGVRGEVRHAGLVLMWRPMDLTLEAKAEQNAARVASLKAQEKMIKGGAGIPGLSSGFEANHPTAVSKNVFNRTIEAPIDVPTE